MKKVLFICPEFFEYHKQLSFEMEKQGYSVTWFSDHLKKVSLFKQKFDKEYTARKQVENIITSTKGNTFDIVFIIFAGRFTRDMILQLKKHFNQATFLYYAWDSFSSYPNIISWYNLFDRSYSFDPEDCKKFGMIFRPLFYTNEIKKDCETKYDFSSVMTIQPSKAGKYNKIINSLPHKLHSFQYLYFPSRILFEINKVRYRKDISQNIVENIHFKKLSYQDVVTVFASSKAVVDCQYKEQKGLTIRTFEVLSLKRKVITTNSEIKNYDFYSPNNIYVVNNSDEIIPNTFFETPFDELYSLNDRYSISSFITDIFKTL